MPLRTLFVDFNSYFASVEQHLRPELRGRPIAVAAVDTDTTVAIAASYEAKKFGVTTGTIIGEAKRMCPGLVVVHARHREYIEYHHRLIDVVESVIHVKEVLSIDEMSCELTGSARRRERAIEIAHDVKCVIAEQVGPTLRCSIGIAPNDFLAKTASDMQKPDGLVVIEDADLPTILLPLELRDFCGIGPQMHKRLLAKGIYTTEMLCAASKQTLRDVWGGIEGERFWQKLRGEDVPSIQTHKSVVGHEHVLEPALRTEEGANAVLQRLIQKAAQRLRSYDLLTGQITVKVRYRDQMRWKAEMDLTPTQDSVQLVNALARMLAQREPHDAQPLKVGVSLTKLVPEDAAPVPMFAGTGPARTALNDSLDKLNVKYGKNTVYFGGAHTARNSAPMRIAFNHIPDIETDSDE
jgi:DNA polymerase-4